MGQQLTIDQQVDIAKDKIEDTILDFESLIKELSSKEQTKLRQLKGIKEPSTLHSVAEQIVVIRSHMAKVRGHINTLQLNCTKLDDVKIQGILVQNMSSVTSILQDIEVLTAEGSVRDTIKSYQASMRNMERDQAKVDQSLRQGSPDLGMETEQLVQQVLIENNVISRLNAPVIPNTAATTTTLNTPTIAAGAVSPAPVYVAASSAPIVPATAAVPPTEDIAELRTRLTALRTPAK